MMARVMSFLSLAISARSSFPSRSDAAWSGAGRRDFFLGRCSENPRLMYARTFALENLRAPLARPGRVWEMESISPAAARRKRVARETRKICAASVEFMRSVNTPEVWQV